MAIEDNKLVGFVGAMPQYVITAWELHLLVVSNTDLYDDCFIKIKNIKNLNHHPFEFYQKVGYSIVGVIPDANGIGKPDIFMSKRLN